MYRSRCECCEYKRKCWEIVCCIRHIMQKKWAYSLSKYWHIGNIWFPCLVFMWRKHFLNMWNWALHKNCNGGWEGQRNFGFCRIYFVFPLNYQPFTFLSEKWLRICPYKIVINDNLTFIYMFVQLIYHLSIIT